MLFTWWPRRADRTSKQSRRRGRRPAAATFRPEVTPLEDRCLLAVVTATSFNGLGASELGGEPPDTVVAAGPTHIVELVNSTQQDAEGEIVTSPQIAFYDKVLGGVVFQQDFFTFFQSISPGRFIFDPVVTYDELAGRFVMAALDVNDEDERSFIDFAVSNTANPLDGWTEMQKLEVTEQTNTRQRLWGDYPKLGWNADAYVFTLNMFTFPVPQAQFANRVQIVTIDKSSVLDGNQSTLQAFRGIDRTNNDFTYAAATMHGSVSGDPMWFVEEQGLPLNNTSPATSEYVSVRVIKMTNVLSGTPTFQEFVVAIPSYRRPTPPTQPNGVTPDPNLDTRMMNAVWRNNRLLATHMVGTGGDSGVTLARWYEFNVAGTGPTLAQTGDIARYFGASTYYPAIEIAINGDLGMTFMSSSTLETMSMYVTGQTFGDTPGVMQTPVLVKAGETNYQGGRAGDYSGISVDPLFPTRFWAASEYGASTTALDNWGSWIVNFTVAGAEPFSTTSRDRAWLNQAYLDLLGRNAEPAGVAFFSALLNAGVPRATVTRIIENSPEYRTRVIQGLYQTILLRPADPAGVAFFLAVFNAGGTVEQIKALLLASDEFYLTRGLGTNAGWIDSVYGVTLGRAPNPLERSHYLRVLALGISRRDIAFQVVTTREALEIVIRGYYQRFLRRNPDAAGLTFFTNLLEQGVRATQPIIVSEGARGFTDQDVIAALVGSEEYFRQI